MTTQTVFQEAMHPMAPLIEAVHNLSIDEVIIAQNQTILVGQVLGPLGVTANMTISAAAVVGTGTQTMGSLTASTTAINGVYSVVQLATSATGAFEVVRPDGTIDGTGKIGTAYTGQINFTITTGGAPTIGDTFAVTVTRPFDEGGEQFEAWGPGPTDGSAVADSVAMYPVVTGSGQTAKIAALRRDGVVRSADLTFAQASFTATQSTTTLTVTAMTLGSGPIVLGVTVTSTGTLQTITGFGTGLGGIGTYTVSVSQTLTAQVVTTAPTAAQIAFATQQLARKSIILR